VNFDVIDHFIKVTDKDGAIAARRLSREEGMFVGWSSGSALHGALEYAQQVEIKKDDVMVILLPDHGTRYLNKIYNDQWMKDHGFLERSFATAKDIITSRSGKDGLFTVSKQSKVVEAIMVMNREGVDQVPVIENNDFVGSVASASLLEKIIFDPQLKDKSVGEIMDKPMIFVALDSTLDVLSSMLNKDNKALLVRDEKEKVHIITQHDILKAITN
jgi:cystathionine beta-synthase